MPESSFRFRRTFDSLSVPAFRWFFLGALALFAASNGLILVRGYVVFELTGSFAALGSVAFASVVPGIAGSIYGGVAADRWSKRRLIQVGQAIVAALAFVIGTLLYLDRIELWHLMASAAVQGGIFGLLAPAWSAILPEMVGKPRIMNATALTMGVASTARLAVPAGFGLMLSLADPEVSYALIVAFLVAAVLAFGRIPAHPGDALRDPRRGRASSAGARALLEGVSYVVRRPAIWGLVVANFGLTLLSMPYLHLMPGYVKQVFRGGPELLGAMVSLNSLGALVCTLILASMAARGRGRLLLRSSALMGLTLIGFAAAPAAWVALVLLLFIGAGQTLRFSLAHVLCQTYVDDAYRGRVLALLGMQMAAAQMGTFLVGIASEAWGPSPALGGMGAGLMLFSAAGYALLPSLRRLD